MIELDVNGHQSWVEPESIETLEAEIARALPEGHEVCTLWVNGDQLGAPQLGMLPLGDVHNVRVDSGLPSALARSALPETSEWIGRICTTLESISSDFRFGRESEASGRLVEVVDALQVLIHLLAGIREHIDVDGETHVALDAPWKDAEQDLFGTVGALADEIGRGDPVQLADRTGYALPRSLHTFRRLIDRIPSA